MNSRSVDDYLAEVGTMLADLPTPAINTVVMRGAGVRFSSPNEGIPGPRRLILDEVIAGSPATGATASALLERQRRNLNYFDNQMTQLVEAETRAKERMRLPATEDWDDHAAEVLGILGTLPVLAGDFDDLFKELAGLARVKRLNGIWQVCTTGGHEGLALEELGDGFTPDALKEQTAANAARLHRWRRALLSDDSAGGAPAAGVSSPQSHRPTPRATAVAGVTTQAIDELGLRPQQKATRRHHERALSGEEPAERRRRFPELFAGIAFTGGAPLSADVLAERRRRFPELYTGGNATPMGRQAGDDGIELG